MHLWSAGLLGVGEWGWVNASVECWVWANVSVHGVLGGMGECICGVLGVGEWGWVNASVECWV